MAQLQCHSCGAAVTIGEPIPRDSECESCRRDLRCCINCRHFDPRYNNSCTETMADPVEDKGRRNFCEYFYFSREPFSAPAAPGGRQDAARAGLERLFGGPAAGDPARQKLDAMFGPKPGGADRVSDARKKLEGLFGEKKPEDRRDSND